MLAICIPGSSVHSEFLYLVYLFGWCFCSLFFALYWSFFDKDISIEILFVHFKHTFSFWVVDY